MTGIWEAYCSTFDPPLKSARDKRYVKAKYQLFKMNYAVEQPVSKSMKRSLTQLMDGMQAHTPTPQKKLKSQGVQGVSPMPLSQSLVPIKQEPPNTPNISQSVQGVQGVSQPTDVVPDLDELPSGSKRCSQRGFSLVFPAPKPLQFPSSAQTLWEELAAMKYGAYKGFAVQHSKGDSAHIHMAVIFRDKPTNAKFTYASLIDYFGKGVSVSVLTRRTKVIERKMDKLFNYCISQEKHPGETISEPILFKGYKPQLEVQTDGETIVLGECSTKIWFLHHLEAGLELLDIYKIADLRRRADICCELSKYQKMMNNFFQLTQDNTSYFPFDSFTQAARDAVADWDCTKTCLILKGETGFGKTEFAKALMYERTNKYACFVSNLNKLGIRAQNQPIIYDDMNFSQCKREKGIHLTDLENDRDIRILFGVHTVPAKTPRIFTTNMSMQDFMPFDPTGAIDRRCTFIDVTDLGKLYA